MRRICVVTGSRAEYGLLYWIMKEIQDDPELLLQVAVTGMHLSPEFGLTYRIIEEDGFAIDAKVEMLLSSDTAVGITKSMALGMSGFADALERLRPELILLLGDRYEVMAAAQAALVARIPIAHIHGGEVTEGVIDEAIRHSITKMAHLHFVAAEPYRKRVLQLGEDPCRVFNFGAPGLDNIARLTLLDRDALQDSIGFSLGELSFLVTYHPVTLSPEGPVAAMTELLAALDSFPEARIIFTKPNSDTAGRKITEMIDAYVERSAGKAAAFVSLGQLRYLSALSHVDAVIGNSSSGLIEAPLLRKATVNVGERQSGRLKALSVIDCRDEREDICRAIKRALSPQFQRELSTVTSLYGHGEASRRIVDCLRGVDLAALRIKKFHDIAGI